jgi:hypothetical protein
MRRTKELRPLGRIWFDCIGKIPVKLIQGYQYVLVLVDEATGNYFVKYLRHRKDIFEAITDWKKEVEAHWSLSLGNVGLSPRVIRFASDGAGEHKSNALANFCVENGIKHDIGTAYEHAQMGKVERAIRTIWEGAEALRHSAGFPPSYWPFMVSAFVYVRNMLPNSMAGQEDDKTPYERWNKHTVSNFRELISHLRIIGCTAYAYVHDELRKRSEWRAIKGVFVGYSETNKAYLLKLDNSKKIKPFRNVYFNETEFPFRDRKETNSPEDFDLEKEMEKYTAQTISKLLLDEATDRNHDDDMSGDEGVVLDRGEDEDTDEEDFYLDENSDDVGKDGRNRSTTEDR